MSCMKCHIPIEFTVYFLLYTKVDCKVAGWGDTRNTKEDEDVSVDSNVLLEANVSVLNMSTCFTHM